MDAYQLLKYIIKPVLAALDMDSKPSQKLVLGTAAMESDMGSYIHQVDGPALGIYQMEYATYNDIANRYLQNKPELRHNILNILDRSKMPEASEMMGNLYLSTIMCRLKYWMIPEAIPDTDNKWDLATYYKKYYNTGQGKATEYDFIFKYDRYCKDLFD